MTAIKKEFKSARVRNIEQDRESERETERETERARREIIPKAKNAKMVYHTLSGLYSLQPNYNKLLNTYYANL